MHELMQISESIERVKAVRKASSDSNVLEVPYILKEAYRNYVEDESSSGQYEAFNNSLTGKEFLVSFDKCIKLPEIWIDATLFVLFN